MIVRQSLSIILVFVLSCLTMLFHPIVFIVFIISVANTATIPEVFQLELVDVNFDSQEYDEVEFVEISNEVPKERKAAGRVYTGNDCEYITISSITSNSGCSICEISSLYKNFNTFDDFRKKICDQAS